VAGFIPLYQRHSLSELISETQHALNVKQLVWSAYELLLAPLIPERSDPRDNNEFVNGFRFVYLSSFSNAVHSSADLFAKWTFDMQADAPSAKREYLLASLPFSQVRFWLHDDNISSRCRMLGAIYCH